jgi:polysaccharide biosynthesis/export protein
LKRVFLVLLPLLAACQSFPQDGPSARTLATEAATSQDYAVIDVDYRITQTIAANPPRDLSGLQGVQRPAAMDLIGPGDTLTVSIFQTLANNGASGRDSQGGDGSLNLPNVAVDRTGGVLLPYAGRIQVGGLSAQQAAAQIQQALRGRMVNPQVVVAVTTNLANSVTLIGEARTAGRFPLWANNDHLLDVIAAAGGATKPSADVLVTLVRGAESR